MSQQDDSAEKSHEPTPRKLEQARKKGDIPRAPDLMTGLAYLGLLLGCILFGKQALLGFAGALLPLVEQPDRLEILAFGPGSSPLAGHLIAASLAPLAPLFVLPAGLVLLALFATRGFTFTPSKLAPKISRMSPVENAKNKYGPRGLFEFFKSFLKLSVYSCLLALLLSKWSPDIIGLSRATPAEALAVMMQLVVSFLTIVTLIALSIGGLDFACQKAEHMRRNRMSQKELRDEIKDSEGDPHIKQQRRIRAQEIVLNQMMGDVPDADVVIVNPTHYAVALKWSRMPGSAPTCVAKGTDAIAARIREIATEAGIPIHSDPPTARAVFATTEIGNEISPDLYRPVAAAIRFAEAVRAHARRTS